MADSTHSIWVDPLAFNIQENGPPYLPETRAKTASGSVLAKLASLFEGIPMSELGALTAVVRAAVMMHQTHHWQSRGTSFYGDHLLFDRLYSESVGFVDQLAERSVGAGSRDLVCPKHQATMIRALVFHWSQGTSDDPSPVEMVSTSLEIIRCVIDCITSARGSLETKGQLSDGTDNLLQGISDKHEEFMYLLQQRAMTAAERVASRYVKLDRSTGESKSGSILTE